MLHDSFYIRVGVGLVDGTFREICPVAIQESMSKQSRVRAAMMGAPHAKGAAQNEAGPLDAAARKAGKKQPKKAASAATKGKDGVQRRKGKLLASTTGANGVVGTELLLPELPCVNILGLYTRMGSDRGNPHST